MGLPNLRHFTPAGITSDPVEALVGEAWVPVVYTDKGWATADGASLLACVEDWRDAVETRQVSGCDLREHPPRNQGGQITKASAGNRFRQSRKKQTQA
jgi:hypothetical protein